MNVACGFPYADLLNLPYPQSTLRRQMAMQERAAQFAPFAILSGYEDAICETARLTDVMPELDDDRKAELDRKQQYLKTILQEQPLVTITHFVPDARKSGGSVHTITAKLLRIDEAARILQLESDIRIAFDAILQLESGDLPSEAPLF